MTIKKHKLPMYKEEIKKNFLSVYPENTAKSYKGLFLKTAPIEHNLQKDIYNFELHELINILEYLKPSTLNASKRNRSIISAYLDWSIENGFRQDNPIKKFSSQWSERFVDKDIDNYLTYEEIKILEDYCENAQDAVIIRLLFEGVNGDECSELLNLKKYDIDFDQYILNLKDTDSKRQLKVSEECISLLKEALNQTQYSAKSGRNGRALLNLMITDRVIRMNYTHNDGSIADKHLIYRRLTNIAKAFGNKNINPKNIQRSGMLCMAKDIFLKNGKLTTSDYEQIFRRYNMNISAGVITSVKKGFLNEKTIKEIYNL